MADRAEEGQKGTEEAGPERKVGEEGSPQMSPCGRIGGCCGTCKEEEARAAAAARQADDGGGAPSPAPRSPRPSRPSLPILPTLLLAVLAPFLPAALWFTGDAGNRALADHMVHDLEELVEDMAAINLVYREVPVAELLREMAFPDIELLEEAVEPGGRAGSGRG